jgi:hypothetical protein
MDLQRYFVFDTTLCCSTTFLSKLSYKTSCDCLRGQGDIEMGIWVAGEGGCGDGGGGVDSRDLGTSHATTMIIGKGWVYNIHVDVTDVSGTYLYRAVKQLFH